MKHSLAYIILLFLPLPAIAQRIIVSEEVTLRSDIAYEIIGDLKGRTLLFRDMNTEFEVQAFDEQMRKSWTKELELDKRLPQVLGLASTPEDFTLIYRFRDRGNTIVKAHRYDAAANLRDSVTIKNYGFLFFTPEFELLLSEDKSKLLIYYFERQSIVHAISFDLRSLTVLWEKSFEPEDFNYWDEFLQVLVDNDGVMRLILEKDNFGNRKDEHRYQIFEYPGANGQLLQYQIPLQGRLTFDVLFVYDNLNKMLVAGGLYSEKNNGRANGYFLLRIPPAGPPDTRLTFHAFEDDFIINLLGKEVDENRGVPEIIIQDIVLRRDGGLLMIAERQKTLERRSSGTSRVFFDGSTRFIVDYYFEEILLFSIHPDGKTHWKTVLHKKQYSQDDGGAFSSFFLFKSPGLLRFIFNDEIRFENTVSEYIINGAGESDRNSVLSTAKLDLRLRFRDALQVSATEAIIPSERRNRLRLVKLVY